MLIDEFTVKLNQWGQQRVPFLFVVDFELEKPFACELAEAEENNVLFKIDRFTNAFSEVGRTSVDMLPSPIPFAEYKKKFDIVAARLKYGDSFLTNLTVKTEVTSQQSLRELFFLSSAKYKLLFRNDFLVFSPETFVRIKDQKIYTFPMKGTIDAAIPDAMESLLNDPKELAEHVTIVDLMRNDLSQVATRVAVTRFRYVEELKTNHKNLLQVSSEIMGELSPDYFSQLGTLLVKLLPAGSVSGAPKTKTLEIIRDAEQEKRGYYTGVFGYFDGVMLESAVMIRFIECQGDQLFYRSGGGITTQSEAFIEYREVNDKIYVPID
jgi:para-aminobenzoate synthetase component 1